MSAATALEKKILATIPLSTAMQFHIDRLSFDEIRVSAPLPPNINIHGTGFAGSIYSVAILTGWALCTHALSQLDFATDLVVAKAEIKYLKPVTSTLVCVARIANEQSDRWLDTIEKRGNGRLLVDIEVGDREALLQASFAARSGPSSGQA